jgi:hypothetical protein
MALGMFAGVSACDLPLIFDANAKNPLSGHPNQLIMNWLPAAA